MALQKDIKLPNGITISYHRIVSITKVTNNILTFEISSYINKEEREKEKEWYKLTTDDKPMLDIYISTEYVNIDYDEDKNIKDLYAYLKTLPEFKDAIDI